MKCTAFDKCTACSNEKVPSLVDASKCVCAVGMFLDDDDFCKSCGSGITGCLECDSKTVCTKCDTTTHWLQNDKCTKNEMNCKVWTQTNGKTCTQCN